jgi:DNA-binding HxlR family transcriptional regulator
MQRNDHCPVEATLELIGGKYKTLILWHLADKKLRFSQLRREISGITPKMLTQQLRELEIHALVHREVFPIVPPKVEYSLTDLGRSLMPLLVAMRDWGSDYLRSQSLEPNCFMLTKDPMPTEA